MQNNRKKIIFLDGNYSEGGNDGLDGGVVTNATPPAGQSGPAGGLTVFSDSAAAAGRSSGSFAADQTDSRRHRDSSPPAAESAPGRSPGSWHG